MSVVNVLSEKLNMVFFREKIALLKRLMLGSWAKPVSVNLVIPQHTTEPGRQLSGEIRVSGGGRSSVIEQVKVAVILDFDVTLQGVNKTVSKQLNQIVLIDKILLGVDVPELVLPFTIQIPYIVPNSCRKTRCILRASLKQSGFEAISAAQEISVVPNCVTTLLFEAIESLGFSAIPDCGEYINRYQRFKFKPASFSAEVLDELTLFVMTGEQDLNIMIEVSKKTKQAGPLQVPVRFTLPYAGIRSAEQIRSMLVRLLAEVRRIS